MSNDLLEQITITAPEVEDPVALSTRVEADPTDIMLIAKLSVTAAWREAELLVLALRARRTTLCDRMIGVERL